MLPAGYAMRALFYRSLCADSCWGLLRRTEPRSPTGRTARFFSPLGVPDFMKRTSVIRYSGRAVERFGQMIEDFADAEGLTGHARSIASDVIKPEVRRLSAYTLKHVKADVNLTRMRIPTSFRKSSRRKSLVGCLPGPGGVTRSCSAFDDTSAGQVYRLERRRHPYRKRLERTHHGRPVGDPRKGAKAVIPQPTFTLYKLLSSVFEAQVTTVPLNASDFTFDVDEIEAAGKDAAVTVICSPNNPTGGLLPAASLNAFSK